MRIGWFGASSSQGSTPKRNAMRSYPFDGPRETALVSQRNGPTRPHRISGPHGESVARRPSARPKAERRSRVAGCASHQGPSRPPGCVAPKRHPHRMAIQAAHHVFHLGSRSCTEDLRPSETHRGRHEITGDVGGHRHHHEVNRHRNYPHARNGRPKRPVRPTYQA